MEEKMGNGEGVKISLMNNPWVMLTAGVLGMAMISSLQYAWALFVPDILKANPTFKGLRFRLHLRLS